VVREALQHIVEKDIVVIDGGDFCAWVRRHLRARSPAQALGVGKLAAIGAGLPQAVAAKLAHPDRRVILFIGDGSFGFYVAELETAIRHRLPITIIIGNDGAWGVERWFQRTLFGDQRLVATSLLQVPYHEVVRALGGRGELVTRADQLPSALERALAPDCLTCVNILIEPIANEALSRLCAQLIAQRDEFRRG
jgi:acetolactate synthase-1/2/3 large subunit